ncbi:molybdopterin molybdotransferase MoeA [Desertivirga xinjiangensis]|uniref:molybdopterin molybdotransferase MoeA n=1 Tax=Desertivirga xinjiangensis TaxID=539206 RepID=UPI00210DF714|nr:molybdopterin molybdotransferase MoeA [Pedobacter xinjiangensis]
MHMLNFRDAQAIISSKAKGFGTELIPLGDAGDRVLAQDAFSDRSYPPFNRSAMDGYAFCLDDWNEGIRTFRIQEIIYAGMTPQKTLAKGYCFKIMTGAPVPSPANVVIRREDTAEADGEVSFKISNLREFQNVAREGEDLAKGDLAIKADSICTPAVISTLAALGHAEVNVKKLPTVSFFTTGNEVKPITSEIGPSEIRNSNEWLIKSLLKKWQLKPWLYAHLIDSPPELEATIKKSLHCDILIMCGGVSAGDADYVPQVLEKCGVTKLFHKVAIKPGKPIWCGQMPRGGMVFALPGNPFSCMVGFKLFIETYLAKSLGLKSMAEELHLPLGDTRVKKSDLDEFFPVIVQGEPSKLVTTAINGSGDIRLGLYADGLAHHPKKTHELSPGTVVSFFKL